MRLSVQNRNIADPHCPEIYNERSAGELHISIYKSAKKSPELEANQGFILQRQNILYKHNFKAHNMICFVGFILSSILVNGTHFKILSSKFMFKCNINVCYLIMV